MTVTESTASRGIELLGVTKSFGSNHVLTDVTAHLPADRIYGLLGANGVGKTTLMSLITNHAFRSSGSILVDGDDPDENAAVRERMCFVREDQKYNDAFSVKDILRVAPAFYPSWASETADRLSERFRLPLTTKSKRLSRGQRSALAIVVTLASRAAYTFLDEPYLGLDASARTIFYEELVAEYAAHPRTVLLSTHLIDEAAPLLEEVLILDQGRIVLQTDIDEASRGSFVVRGRESDVLDFVGGRALLTQRRLGGLLSVTVRGELNNEEHRRADELRLSVEPTSLQEFVAALGIHALDQSAPQNQTEKAS